MICPNCNHENSDKNIRFCENCGYELQNIKKQKHKKKTIAVISVLLVVIISVVSCTAFYYFHTKSNNQKSKEDKYYMSSFENVFYTSDDYYETNGIVYSKEKSKYNENGYLIEKTEWSEDTGTIIFVINYDADGKVTQIIITDDESEESEAFNFSYSNKNDENIGVAIIQDEENQRIIQCIYDSDNCIKEYSITETDSNGNSTVLQREIYDKSGKPVQSFDKDSQTSNEYNEQGLLVHWKTISSDDYHTIYEMKTEYDENNQVSKKECINSEGSTIVSYKIIEDTRNEENGILKTEIYNDDVYSGYCIENYHNGIISKAEQYDEHGELYSRDLYDEYGHNTNMIYYSDGEKTNEYIQTWELKESAKNTKGE